MTSRALSITQAAIGIVALIGITILGVTNSVSSDALVAIYSAVIGSALGASGAIANARARSIENGQADATTTTTHTTVRRKPPAR